MTTYLSKLNQWIPGRCQGKARFTPTALALAVMSFSSAVLPVQSVQAEGANVIEEIIVTARKREESMQDIPVVVSVLSGDTLESQRIESISDVGSIVPGLVTGRNFASTSGTIYLRGVGTGGGSPLFDQAVAINIDSVGISSAQLMNAAMFDLQQIEVLRGPQALFFGKNSPGGVIAIRTNDPTDEFEMQLTAMYETEREEQVYRGVISGPLSETLSGRLSLGWSDSDGHLFDIHNFDVFETGPGGQPVQTGFATGNNPVQTERTYAMGTLLWEPTDSFSARLKYAYLDEDRDGSTNFNFQRTACGLGVPQVLYPVPGIDNCKLDGDVVAAGFNPVLTASTLTDPNHNGNGYFETEEDFVALEIDYDLNNDLSLTSVTGYFENSNARFSDASNQVAAGLANPNEGALEQWSQEFRLVSSYDGSLNFALGAYYEEKEIFNSTEVTVGSNLAAGIPPSVLGVVAISGGRQKNWQDSTAYSFFGQLIWDFADNWTLSAGARYSYEEKEAESSVDFAATPAFGLPAVPPTDILLLEPKADWDNVSPEVSLSYRFSDDVMFFASFRTGFKSGGYDGSFRPGDLLAGTASGTPFDSTYNEEEADGFELGMKSDLADGRVRVNVTAFRYEYDDLQLSRLTAGSGGIPALQALNAGAATTQGLELETAWATPVDGLTLTANIAWVDAEFDEYIADCITGQTIAAGCNVNPNPLTGNFTQSDMAGEPLQQAPELNATFALDYFFPLGSNWNAALNVTAAYKDDYNPTSQPFPEEWWQDSYWLTNASASLRSSDDKWEFFVRAVNLGEEYYSQSGFTTPLTGNGALTGTNDPSGAGDFTQAVTGGRQISLGLTYRL